MLKKKQRLRRIAKNTVPPRGTLEYTLFEKAGKKAMADKAIKKRAMQRLRKVQDRIQVQVRNSPELPMPEQIRWFLEDYNG